MGLAPLGGFREELVFLAFYCFERLSVFRWPAAPFFIFTEGSVQSLPSLSSSLLSDPESSCVLIIRTFVIISDPLG